MAEDVYVTAILFFLYRINKSHKNKYMRIYLEATNLNFYHISSIFSVVFFSFFLVLASRQIRRRVPYAGHLMTPRRLWLNKIPTLCDVVIEFPGN